MNAAQAWTPEEDAVLREASVDRRPFPEVVAELDRTPRAIRSRAQKLGVGLGHRRSYDAAERAQIRLLAACGKHYHEIAEALGFKADNLKAWCLRNGVRVKPTHAAWSLADKKAVALRVRQAVDELAAQLNRSPRSILHQMIRAGVLYAKMHRPINRKLKEAA